MNFMELFQQLEALKKQLEAMQKQIMPKKSNRERFYEAAKASLDEKLVGENKRDKGCVIAVRAIYKQAFGKELCETESTAELYAFLKRSEEWKKVSSPEPGDIVLAATGQGNGEVKNGHVCIAGKHWYMSNTSATGIWQTNYSPQHFSAWFGTRGGYPIHIFRMV